MYVCQYKLESNNKISRSNTQTTFKLYIRFVCSVCVGCSTPFLHIIIIIVSDFAKATSKQPINGNIINDYYEILAETHSLSALFCVSKFVWFVSFFIRRRVVVNFYLLLFFSRDYPTLDPIDDVSQLIHILLSVVCYASIFSVSSLI